jgi:tetratricopeptide (TPR) repeat protein
MELNETELNCSYFSMTGRQVRRFALAQILFCAVSVCQPSPPQLSQAQDFLNQGKPAQSIPVLRDFLRSNPVSADGHYLLGLALFRDVKPEEALVEFNAGARLRRPTPEELKTVASTYVLLNDFVSADKWFTVVTIEVPKDANSWYLLGRTKYNRELFTDAIQCFQRALLLQSGHIEAENNLGLSYQAMNSDDSAELAFRTAISWQREMPRDAQPYLNLGILLANKHMENEALPYLKQAVTLAPENPRIHEELGVVYGALNDLKDAESQLESAVSLAPDVPGLHYKLGQIYRRDGMNEKATEELEACKRLNSTHSSTPTPNPFHVPS